MNLYYGNEGCIIFLSNSTIASNNVAKENKFLLEIMDSNVIMLA